MPLWDDRDIAGELEKARASVAAAARGDVAGAIAYMNPQVEMDMSAIPDGTLLRGRDAVASYLRDHRDAWGEMSVEIEAAEQHGGRVLLVQVERGVGRSSGAAVESRYANLFDFDEGAIARVRYFDDVDSARSELRRASPPGSPAYER